MRRIHARAWTMAKGPTVVLVHGLVVSSRYLVPLAEQLAPSCRVHAPDLPGFGLSEKPERVLDVPALADALGEWLEAADLERPALFGNSLGCQIAADLAARRPELLSRLVLSGPTVDPAARPEPRLAARWLLEVPGQVLMAHVLLADYRDAGLRRFLGTFRAMVADRIEEKLPRIQAPTLVVRGDRDRVVSQEWAEEVTRLLPKGRLVVLRGARHSPNFGSPAELARVMLPFLSE